VVTQFILPIAYVKQRSRTASASAILLKSPNVFERNGDQQRRGRDAAVYRTSKQLVESVLGYDAREMSGASREAWNCGDRREYALLRGNVDTPLSVATAVWRGAVDTNGGLPGGDDFLKANLPRWTGRHYHMWESLEELEHFCRTVDRHMPVRYWLIAITVMVTPGLIGYFSSTVEQHRMVYPDEATPRSLDPEWVLIGYDVADASIPGPSTLANYLRTFGAECAMPLPGNPCPAHGWCYGLSVDSELTKTYQTGASQIPRTSQP